MILNDGSDLVLMGYKTEGRGIALLTINGGRSEVMGGVLNIGRTGEKAFVARDAEMRIATATHGWLPGAYYRTAISHSRKDENIEIRAEDMPTRSFDKSRGPQYMIPLYK